MEKEEEYIQMEMCIVESELMVKDMEKECYLTRRKIVNMKEIGKIIGKMVEEWKYEMMDRNTLESFSMDRKMEKESFIGVMETSMKESFKMVP